MSKMNGKKMKSLATADRDAILKNAASGVRDYVSLLEEQIEQLSEIGLEGEGYAHTAGNDP